MIRSFKGKLTEEVWTGEVKKGFPQELVRRAQVKLAMIASAEELADLRRPPANRLEALRGERAGQYSIRINDQWRICFAWKDGGAADVEIVDYH
jgi:proteic killer suppression protein